MDMREQYHKPLAPRAKTAGFTLVELLVVVSIIALLISILLPSLRKAQDQAKLVKCLANLGGIGKGNITYSTEWNGWFVGSPATTGQQAFGISGFTGSGSAAQIWDWAGPIAAQTTELHWHLAERWRRVLTQDSFLCPKNQFFVGAYPTGVEDPDSEYEGWGSMRMPSYYTMRAFMTRGGTAPQNSPLRIERQYFHPQVGGTEDVPAGYAPRIERVGSPSEKVFLSDSARFIELTPGNERITYNPQPQASAGGAFSVNAPTSLDEYNRSFIRPAYRRAWPEYSYRHGNGSELG
ncbi:MAG: prepilin-type N-terminal cleavage/methylation domain-containing protein, partial [bacterium]|nr:prepilin-type N-terminal cleavage/methylation domain-containing protein [bacterium]